MSISKGLVNNIALQAAQVSNNGLYHGRMGMILSLYCYGEVQGDAQLCEYAKDILQTSTNDYYDGEIGLENGLAGIGLGFTLLHIAGMFKDDLNDLLFEIDSKIMKFDPRRLLDVSFREGASGILYYINMRKSTGQEILSLDQSYITELETSFSIHRQDCIPSETLLKSLKPPSWNADEYLGKEAGMDRGNAYFLIQDSYDKIFSCQ